MRRSITFVAAVLALTIAIQAQTGARSKKSLAQHVPDKDLSTMIDQIRNSVVKIEVNFQNNYTSTGTGVFINTDGMIITARHVIYPPGISQPPLRIRGELRLPTVTGGMNILASWSSVTSTVVAVDEAHDLALLKPENPRSNPFPDIGYVKTPTQEVRVKPLTVKFDSRLLRDGEAVFTSGYPMQLPILITTSGFVASSDPFLFEQAPKPRVQDAYWVDMQVNGGNSGGPLFSRSSGTVIGIVLAYSGAPVEFGDHTPGQANGIADVTNPLVPHPLVSNSGIAVVLPARYIVEFLDRQTPAIRYNINKGH